MYNKVYERIWPGKTWGYTLSKIMATNLISDPVFFFPTFYTFREVCNTGTVGTDQFKNGMIKYSYNYWNDWLNSWTVWLPAHTVTYGLVPPHLRVPWIASVSFGYVCLLSSTRGGYEDEAAYGDEDDDGQAPCTSDAPATEAR